MASATAFDFLASLCGSAAAMPLGGGVALGLLLAGATGSVMHCAPMCGPFVLGQVADRMTRLPATRLCELQRIRGALLLPYHLGRITTYAGLGALSALLGATLARQPWLSHLSTALLLLAALLFLGQALQRLVPALHIVLPAIATPPRHFVRLVGRIAARVDRSTFSGGLLLGLALGFLPCGFLYAALAAASASGGPVQGAIAMVAFGLGTVPSLVAVGIAGQAAGYRWQRATTALAPAVMLLNAVLLAALGLRGVA
jgi:sulfite exporter TauE/SafE